VIEQALAKRPGHVGLHANLAKALRAQERYAQAIPHFEKALAAKPGDAGAWFDLGFCYQQTKQNEKAIVAYKRHLALSDGTGADSVRERIRGLGSQ
jgi:Flp pilus assembly protein TadD